MIPFPKKKYTIIYADPPWQWKTYSKKGILSGWAEKNYPLMNTEDICNLPIKEITDNNCILFLWVTFPKLKDGIKVLESWGFDYKTVGFSWVKLNPKGIGYYSGLGYYTRSNVEICLIGRKGSLKVVDRKVKQLVVSPRGKHSEKPKEVRNRIVQMYGDVERIELFARDKPNGWDVWGNEVSLDTQQEGGNGIPPTDKSVGIQPTIL